MKYLFFVCIAFLLSTQVFAQFSVIDLTDETEAKMLGEMVFFLEDSTAKLTIEEVEKPENQSKFKKNEREILHFKRSQNWFWIRIELENKTATKNWLVEISQSKIALANLFFQNENGKWTEIKNGYDVPTAQKFKNHYYQVFPLSFYQNRQVIYIHTKGNLQNIPITIVSPQTFESFHLQRNLIYGLFFGFMLFIILNNLAFGILTKNKIYLLYVCVVSSYTLGSTFLSGYAKLFFDINLLKALSVNNLLGLILMILYAKMFLNVAFKSLINKFLNVLIVVLFVGICLAFWLNLAKIFIFMQIMGAVVMVSIVVTAVLALKNKQPFARYYLLAIAFLIVFSFMEIAHGSLGKPHYFLLAHLEWAFLFEVAVLAYGLNRRFDFEQKQLQKAKEDAQKQAIIHAQKNENLVRNQNQILEEKVQERTEKLQIVNEELVVMNEELQQIQEEITMQRDMLESKNDLLEEYTHKVKKSIQAAQTTQKAILPSKEKMKELFENYFVLFKPKDVVSGDFWWADFLEIKDIGQEQALANAKKMKYLIVADCTGHGVSGAMLTMIGSALLDRIIAVMDINKPAEILEKLHQEIKIALRQDKTQNNEGMDIAVLSWYEEKNHCVLTFSAAKRPLYYTLEGKINKLSGTRRSIGGTLKVKKKFEEKTFILPKGNRFYLCSDGYIDQNNLERNGFTENRLLNLLQEHQNLEMLAQKNILKQELATHMNGVEQRDDILIIGVKI